MRTIGQEPEIVLRNSEPSVKILDINQCQEPLELLEDRGNLRGLQRLRKEPVISRAFADCLNEN